MEKIKAASEKRGIARRQSKRLRKVQPHKYGYVHGIIICTTASCIFEKSTTRRANILISDNKRSIKIVY